ncbi:MAG TPA: MBL fold metallo-hydrolase [Gammaproteobacteria bacterium]
MQYRLFAVGAFAAAAALGLQAQPSASGTPEELVAAAKRAAGRDHSGTFLRICVAPDNLNAAPRPPPATGPGDAPDRAAWYAAPYKVFDNLYFVGTKIHSSWALTTTEGIILIDTLFDYAIEPEILDGLTALGLHPRDIEYVLISHAHGDHDQGAALLQSRYGARIVMGEADWEVTLQRPENARGGVPKRDIAVGPDGMKITLGDTTIDVIATPGHTRGTLSYIFPGARWRSHADGGLCRRHGVQLPTRSRQLRDLPRQPTEDARGCARGRRDRTHVEPHGIRPRLRPRTHRAAAARPGRETPLRDRRSHRAALLRNGQPVCRSRAAPHGVRELIDGIKAQRIDHVRVSRIAVRTW